MEKVIPYSHQSIDSNDIKAVVDVLRSGWLTQGPVIRQFEEDLCRYTGARFAVCVANGTAALHLACLAAGVGCKDEVITSPITFLASANCALYCGAVPVFADVDPVTVNMTAATLRGRIGKRSKAVIPVHFAGRSCDMEEISKAARRSKLVIIEDAAHALGADYKGLKAGSCAYSDMTILSFHPVKSITTGEGGAVMTNSKRLYERLMSLRTHGVVKNSAMARRFGGWYYEMRELGFNYRITDIQAALGCSQLKRLDAFISRRREIAAAYRNAFRGNPNFDIPAEERHGHSAYHLYPITLKGVCSARRKAIFESLRGRGLGVQVHYIPVHLQPYYRKRFGYGTGMFPAAESYYSRAISLPIYPSMSRADIARVIRVCKEVIHE